MNDRSYIVESFSSSHNSGAMDTDKKSVSARTDPFWTHFGFPNNYRSYALCLEYFVYGPY